MLKNDIKYKTRPSPPFSATLFPNEIKEGNDNEEYISKKDKNGIYKWYKITLKKNPEEYYKQLPDYIKPKYNINIFTQNLKTLVKDLKKINVTFYFIKWNIYGDNSFEYEYFSQDNKLSNNYLQESLNELNAIHFNSNNADIDLCCAIKAKHFVQGKGFYSQLIVEVRRCLGLNSIETRSHIFE